MSEDNHEINTHEVVHEEEHPEAVVGVEEHAEEHATGAHGEEHAGETHEEVKHETTLFAEPVFHIGGFTVTNALINSWVVVFLIILLSVVIRKKLKKIPGVFQNFVEVVIEGALNLVDSVTGDRKKTLKFLYTWRL